MSEERIIIKRFYLKNAMLFGLYYGLIIGIIAGTIVFLISMLGFNSLPGLYNAVGVGAGAVAGIIVMISYTVLGLVGSVVGALFYNLIAKAGGEVHFGLAEANVEKP